jgi:hypothetical protein
MNAVHAPGLQVEIRPIPDGLRVRVRGEESYENTLGYWREIARVAHADRARRILLVDELQGTPLTEAQWLQLVLSMADEGIAHMRIAHAKPSGMHEVEYCEVFARDAGIDARVFPSEDAAAAWLAEDGGGDADGAPEANGFGSARFEIDRSVPGVFLARVSGRGGDADAAARRWRHFIATARANRKTRLMVARDLDGPVLSEAGLVRMIGQLSDLDLDGLRIALVQPRLERQRIDEIGALMAMELGGVVSVFEDEPSALIWLRHGSDDEARRTGA